MDKTETFWQILEVFRTLGVLVSAIGMIWLCTKVDMAIIKLSRHGETHDLESKTHGVDSAASSVSVGEALARMEKAAEKAVAAAQAEALSASQKLAVTTELGYQNAAAATRMEANDALVASDLAQSHDRADDANGPVGHRADEAARSAPAEEYTSSVNPQGESMTPNPPTEGAQ